MCHSAIKSLWNGVKNSGMESLESLWNRVTQEKIHKYSTTTGNELDYSLSVFTGNLLAYCTKRPTIHQAYCFHYNHAKSSPYKTQGLKYVTLRHNVGTIFFGCQNLANTKRFTWMNLSKKQCERPRRIFNNN